MEVGTPASGIGVASSAYALMPHVNAVVSPRETSDAKR
jgi:hypothetical protein